MKQSRQDTEIPAQAAADRSWLPYPRQPNEEIKRMGSSFYEMVKSGRAAFISIEATNRHVNFLPAFSSRPNTTSGI